MKISELELASGVPRSRIYYYIQEGLLHPPDKTGKTIAYYDLDHLKELQTIEGLKLDHLRATGKFRMPIRLLKHQLEQGGTPPQPAATVPQGHEDEGEHEYKSNQGKAIVEAALKLYCERGYYHTNLRDIAKEAGISAAAIYFYFPGKREIFGAVIDSLISEINRTVEEVLRSDRDIAEKYLGVFEVYRGYYPRLVELVNQLKAGVIIKDEWAHDKIQRIYNDLAAVIKRVNLFYIQAGALRDDVDVDLLTYYIISVTEAAFQRTYLDEAKSPEEIFAFFFDVAYNGLAPQRRG